MIHIAEAAALHGKFVELTYTPNGTVTTGYLGFFLDSIVLWPTAEAAMLGKYSNGATYIGDTGSRKDLELKDLSEVKINLSPEEIERTTGRDIQSQLNDDDGNASHYLNN